MEVHRRFSLRQVQHLENNALKNASAEAVDFNEKFPWRRSDKGNYFPLRSRCFDFKLLSLVSTRRKKRHSDIYEITHTRAGALSMILTAYVMEKKW